MAMISIWLTAMHSYHRFLRIDLGAFGQETSPAKSQTYFSSFISLLLMKKISSHLKLFVEPGYAFYDAQTLHNVFSIMGSIDVSFN